MSVRGRAHTHPVVNPHRLAHQLTTARATGNVQAYHDVLASTAALCTVSNVNGTARLLKILVDQIHENEHPV